jgi:hypothetical protein
MTRRLKNWLDSYKEYTFNTEPARQFHDWIGLSVIASALRKKVWFRFGRIRVHPNLFVVLVSEPGIARKTQAITYGEEIVGEVSSIVTSADAITPQAMLEDLEIAKSDEVMPDGSSLTHNSLSIISGEFESFLGQKKDNTKMLVLLTDLYDCKIRPYRYRTKGAGSNVISSPFLNLQAATTPESLASSLPSTAIGGGLTTRILFIWADEKAKKVAIPTISDEVKELKKHLIHDLTVISRIIGAYTYTKESRKWWKDWYNSYEELSTDRLCKDPNFRGWYSRKPTLTIKVSMLLTAAKGDTLTVGIEEFEEALETIESVEETMHKAFMAVGRSDITPDVALVMQIVQRQEAISEKQLLSLVWRDIDALKFDNVIATCIKTGNIHRDFRSPTGKPGVWYKWLGKRETRKED